MSFQSLHQRIFWVGVIALLWSPIARSSAPTSELAASAFSLATAAGVEDGGSKSMFRVVAVVVVSFGVTAVLGKLLADYYGIEDWEGLVLGAATAVALAMLAWEVSDVITKFADRVDDLGKQQERLKDSQSTLGTNIQEAREKIDDIEVPSTEEFGERIQDAAVAAVGGDRGVLEARATTLIRELTKIQQALKDEFAVNEQLRARIAAARESAAGLSEMAAEASPATAAVGYSFMCAPFCKTVPSVLGTVLSPAKLALLE